MRMRLLLYCLTFILFQENSLAKDTCSERLSVSLQGSEVVQDLIHLLGKNDLRSLPTHSNSTEAHYDQLQRLTLLKLRWDQVYQMSSKQQVNHKDIDQMMALHKDSIINYLVFLNTSQSVVSTETEELFKELIVFYSDWPKMQARAKNSLSTSKFQLSRAENLMLRFLLKHKLLFEKPIRELSWE